jgi:hypothetical protein
MSKSIRFHDFTTPGGREDFMRKYRAKHNLPNPAYKVAAKALPVGFKELLSGERGKLGLCPSTRLEAFKATPFPGSFKLGPKQRLHRWLCDECGFWHGQIVNYEDLLSEEPPSDHETTHALKSTPARQPGPDIKWTQRAGSRAGKLSKEKK